MFACCTRVFIGFVSETHFSIHKYILMHTYDLQILLCSRLICDKCISNNRTHPDAASSDMDIRVCSYLCVCVREYRQRVVIVGQLKALHL